MKKAILIIITLCSISLISYAQTGKPLPIKKYPILSDVALEGNWGDSLKADTLYTFQLTGHLGKIKNIKLKLAVGTLETLMDNRYRVKLSKGTKALDISFTKLDPMTKEVKTLKQVIVPVKK